MLHLLAAVSTFGFDTEFVGEDTYHPRLCLVQVATPERLFLIDPLTAGPLDAFWKLVVDPARVVVVHAGREEVRLCRLWTGQTPGNLFDLQLAAGLVGMPYPIGHGPLVNQVLGVQLAKGETLTEWRRRPLTAAQIRYAFDDVRYCCRPGRSCPAGWKSWGGGMGARGVRPAGTTAPGRPGRRGRWRKLRGHRLARPARLAVVRALYRWREEAATQANRPARTIVRDDLIVEIARRNPTRARDLQVVRGLPSRDLDAIVEVVQEARAPAPGAVPRGHRARTGPAAGQPRGQRAHRGPGRPVRPAAAGPNLVASNTDIRAPGASAPGEEPLPEEFPGARLAGRHILPELLAVLEGRRALWIDNLDAEAPLDYDDLEDPSPV